jgi:hypothetical protein
MGKPRLNLVVIRSPDIDRAASFYEALGLSFQKHAHGSGPQHYASEHAGTVFEIYPLRDGDPPTTATRIGFAVNDVDAVFAAALTAGGQEVTAPRDSTWGRRAVVADLDDHCVELVQPK